MDYARLRATALQHGEDEEAVTVDTRALIDKVLARYSGEWTTLRELIQNAADAQATNVQIKFETLPSHQIPLPSTSNRSELLKHVITNHTLRRLVVQNDGQPFTKTDWNRLKRIAEGNPDESKIGAFGVGFYSVFADCEEPFVSSGSEAMAFYWKGNALFTRKLQLSPAQCTADTAFVLDYRNSTTPLPNLLSVSQFLATSLTFVALERIEFWVDDYQILSLQKKTSASVDLAIPPEMETKTKEGLMKLASADQTKAQVDATFMSVIGWKAVATSATRSSEVYNSEMPSLRNFFSRLAASSTQAGLRGKQAREDKAAQDAIAQDLTATSTCSIFLRVMAAQIKTSVSTSFAAELERATKKPPPKTTKLAILTSSYDETIASEDTWSTKAAKAIDIFSTVLPSKKPGGRIFIGFPTTQTTGAGMHISAPSVIPTVEREAVDLNARWVRTWNVEMLRMAGVMARLAFSNEMSELAEKVKQAGMEQVEIDKHVPEALHILKTYAFGDSTPSGQVGQIMEEAFWMAYRRASIEVYSSRGVLSSTKVRTFSEQLARFVNHIPVILPSMKDASFMRKLMDFGLITDITVDDIYNEFVAKALDKEQLQHFIAWAGKAAMTDELDQYSKRRLLDAAVATVSDGGGSGDVIALASITNFHTSKIPSSLPIPPTTLPIAFTANVPTAHLEALGWEPLELVPWLRFLIASGPGRDQAQDVVKSARFASQVLAVLSKNWDNVSASSRDSLRQMLEPISCIPTKMGMRKPDESFFSSVKVFDDLPTVQLTQPVKEKFLAALGVRKTLKLDIIFERLLNASDGQRWSHVELIKYLASVQDDIPPADMKKLKESKFCPAEAGPPGGESSKGTTELYKLSDLFEPKDTLRALKLPLLQWPGPPGSFRHGSTEARFLLQLGLRSFPSGPELVDMMASDPLRDSAMTYFIANHDLNKYAHFDISKTDKAILPLDGDKRRMPPSACYTNEAAAVLAFPILQRDLHQHASKFGVARDPPMADCVARLVAKPPNDRGSAAALFTYFSTRLGDLGSHSLAKLKDAAIVPVTARAGPESSITLIRPTHCYLGSSSTYGDIFDFVDFGSNANAFLFKCGAKSEPSKVEIAQMACSEPARLLGILQSSDKYLDLIRTLAVDLPILKQDRALYRKMKTSAWLLAFREISAKSTAEEDETIKQYQLAAPSQISILDDYISYRLFKTSLLCAPEEDALEAFYMALGAETLGSKVQEDIRIGSKASYQRGAVWLRKHVLERSKLFLHEWARHKRDSIKHDEKWLEQHLQVETVKTVALRRCLRGSGESHTEQRSAASAKVENAWILYVAADGRPDMYQVGQAICQLLLTRPSQQSYFFFEPFLKLELLDLRARGYNVDRILRAKAAEARIAEDDRRKALEVEQEKIRQQEAEWASRGASEAAAAARQSLPAMPGSFDFDDSEAGPPSPKRKGGFFSEFTRKLGLETDDGRKQADKVGKELENRPAPVPRPRPTGSSKGPQDNPDDGRVTSPAVIQQNLLNAIKSTRPHDSAGLFTPPQQNEVKEQTTYCDATPAQNISFAAEAPGGMRIFIARDPAVDTTVFLRQNMWAIATMETLLKEVGGIYGLPHRSLHIFYDAHGSTIAFNNSGSIFCNLRFYLQLHADSVRRGHVQARIDATTWWWVVLAHELAHNLAYFGKMASKAALWMAVDSQGASPPPPRDQDSLPLPPPPPYSAPADQDLLD